MRIFTTALLILIALCSTASIGQTQSTTAPIFNPPLGYRDNYVYGAPYYADYGIKNTGVWYESFISSTSDNDWYSFPVTVPSGSARNIDVYLQSIPPGANYNLELYSPSNQLLRSSTQPSNNDEFIRYYTTSSGAYRIRVYSASGFSHTDSYDFRVDVVSAPTQ